MSPLALFILVAAIIAAACHSPVQAGIATAVWILALAVQLAWQAGVGIAEPEVKLRPDEPGSPDDALPV
jgi:hypothetical protein